MQRWLVRIALIVGSATVALFFTAALASINIPHPIHNQIGSYPAGPSTYAAYVPPAAVAREGYAHIVSHSFRLTAVEPRSTFAADVDTASYANVRRFIERGTLPPVDAVRVEELINYFRFPYEEPTADRPISVTTEVGRAPWAPAHRLVLIGLRARAADETAVGPRNIVLLLDVSGSMQAPNKLPLVKQALRMFVDTLRPQDRIGIVVYAGASGLVLPSTPASERHVIHDAIERLQAGGSTNGAEGIQLAYRVARQHFVPGGVNRVILATDGDFNMGVTSDGALVRLIEQERTSGVFLSVLAVGEGNLQDAKMEALSNHGNGTYAYLDSLYEARRVLGAEGGATLETVAQDVKLQVELNPDAVAAWRLIGYENRQLAHEDFNDDTKDAGEMGAGHTVTVLYEIVPPGVPLPEGLDAGAGAPLRYQTERRATGSDELLTVKIRYQPPGGGPSALLTHAVGAETDTRTLPFAAAVAEFGQLLRDPTAGEARWHGLTARLADMPVVLDRGGDQVRFRELVELAAGLPRLSRY